MFDIRQITLQEFRDSKNVDAMIDSYAEEAKHDLVPVHNPDYELYNKMEKAGIFKCIGAYDGDTIVGFAVVLITQMPHYSKKSATVESIYVSLEYRKSGVGISMIREVEALASRFESSNVFISATIGSRIDTVAGRSGYVATHTTYSKAIA